MNTVVNLLAEKLMGIINGNYSDLLLVIYSSQMSLILIILRFQEYTG